MTCRASHNSNPGNFSKSLKSLQILFTDIVESDWASAFAWQDRILDATGLLPDHPTLARDTGAYVRKQLAKKHEISNSLLAKTCKLYAPHFERLMVEIRIRNYSIRTEKSYSEWLARYISFNDMQDQAKFADIISMNQSCKNI